MKKRNIFKVLALLCVLVLVIGSIPVSAAKLKTISRRINNGFASEDAATIRITTNAEGTIVVHSGDNTKNKNLYINAPNAKVVNYADVNIVSIKACRKYIDKGNGNTIKVIGSALVQVTPDGDVDEIIVATKGNVDIVLGAGAVVDEVEIIKKGADVEIDALEDADADIVIKKKAKVQVNGEYSNVNIFNKADDTEIIANTRVDITTEKDLKLTVGANADGTTVDKTSAAIDVKITNPQGTVVTETIDGEPIDNGNPDNGSGSAIGFEN